MDQKRFVERGDGEALERCVREMIADALGSMNGNVLEIFEGITGPQILQRLGDGRDRSLLLAIVKIDELKAISIHFRIESSATAYALYWSVGVGSIRISENREMVKKYPTERFVEFNAARQRMLALCKEFDQFPGFTLYEAN